MAEKLPVVMMVTVVREYMVTGISLSIVSNIVPVEVEQENKCNQSTGRKECDPSCMFLGLVHIAQFLWSS